VHAAWHTSSLQRLQGLWHGAPVSELFAWLDDKAKLALQAQGLQDAARAEKRIWRHRFGDPAAPIPMLWAVGRRDEGRQMLNPLRVLTSGVECCAQVPLFASGQWRFTERVRWWDHYTDDTPVVVGHYWRQFVPLECGELGKGGLDLFEGIAPNAWLGTRGNVFCVDFSAGGRWQERRCGGRPGARMRLAALRWPEREVMLDSGATLPTTGFGKT
jgi:hypothetical protein